MTPVSYAQFILAFPEFLNPARYTEGQFDFWSGQAYIQLNACRFGQSLPLAVMLFTAHNMVLSAQAAAAAATASAAGSAVGQAAGPVNSKAVDKVSVAYSPDLTAAEGGEAWNATTYGQRLYKMMAGFSTGPAYVPGPRRWFGPVYR